MQFWARVASRCSRVVFTSLRAVVIRHHSELCVGLLIQAAARVYGYPSLDFHPYSPREYERRSQAVIGNRVARYH